MLQDQPSLSPVGSDGMSIQPTLVRGGLAPWQERRAKYLLRNNLDGQKTMGEIAYECRISRKHFTRAFRNSTGLPPLKWLNSLRIEIAKRLLCSSNLTVVEIAVECGFADAAHLARIFHGYAGVAPGKWRKQARIKVATFSQQGGGFSCRDDSKGKEGVAYP